MSERVVPTAELLKETAARFKGKGGGPESENTIVDSKIDRKEDGTVSVWAMGGTVTKIINRCNTAIKYMRVEEEGVSFYIDKSAFRGVTYAFKVVK
jgi:hypothetical protein|tara:strand:- start:7 stop:294 length:288 start_codon:yes stop_codon:yes gene_type:complete